MSSCSHTISTSHPRWMSDWTVAASRSTFRSSFSAHRGLPGGIGRSASDVDRNQGPTPRTGQVELCGGGLSPEFQEGRPADSPVGRRLLRISAPLRRENANSAGTSSQYRVIRVMSETRKVSTSPPKAISSTRRHPGRFVLSPLGALKSCTIPTTCRPSRSASRRHNSACAEWLTRDSADDADAVRV